MGNIIRIRAGAIEAQAELNQSATARKIAAALPLQAPAQTWGDEIYFAIPVECQYENPKDLVELGDLGYWVPGSAFCIFFGPTPASEGDEIRPASPVNVLGKVIGDPTVFKAVKAGEQVTIEAVEG